MFAPYRIVATSIKEMMYGANSNAEKTKFCFLGISL